MKQQNIKLLLVLLISLLSVNASAHDIEVANTDGKIIYYRYINNNTELEVSYRGNSYNSYSGEYSGNVVIPESVTYNGKTYSVTSIGSSAFRDCSGLTSVTIPNSVTSIGNFSFYGCSSLTSVTIPNSVTSIGDDTFYGCSGLTGVTIPNSVTSIGNYSFYGCSSLTSVTIPNSVTSIGSSAFRDCSGLKSVNISDLAAWCNISFGSDYANPLYYAHHLFLNGEEIKDLVIPNSVTSIGDDTFYGCSGLTSVTIPNSVTSIGERAFRDCSGLTSVTIPNSVTSIGEYAFYNCSGLKSVNISDLAAWCNISFSNYHANPLYYAHHLFLNGEEIKYLVIPNSVTSIKWAFFYCSGLTSVTIPNSVTSIGGDAFYGCSGLTSVTIPNSVTSIGARAFYGCSVLTSVISEITEPFNCGTNAFPDNACRNGTLYVPAGTKDLYIRFDGWRNFLHIEEGGEAAKYRLSFVVNNKELSTKNVEVGATIAPPSTDGEGNTVTWYTYPATMPAHDLVVYGMVVKPEPAPAPAKYTLTYMLDGQQYKQETIEAGAAVAKETAPSKEGYTFSGWQNEPTTMPAQNTTVTGRFTINSYRLSFIAENRELSSKNVTYGSQITAPSTDGEGNTITWYTYPTTMPAHDLVVYGMVVKPEPEPAPAKYTLTYMLDGQQYKQVTIEAGAAVAKETAPSKEGYTFSGWQNEPTTMPAQNTTVTGRFTINSYRLSFIAENRELSSKNVTYGSSITAPSTDGEGNTVTWYTYPATMPAHDLVVYGMVVKQPEPEVLVWLTVKDGQGTTKMKVRQGTEQVLTITPEEGWKVVSVTWNGTDVTAQTKDGGSYTTPAITGDATLAVVYEQDAPSDVASARAGQATVTVVDDGVVIAHAEPQSRCVVYASNGQQVVSTVIESDSQKIRLQKGQVYILTINGRTLKFAL